ncbi:hypothetical protein A9K55_008257 [Cordyceps militaris]|uniref:Uncharacterized protein n=1 Tax=Cordyceps militaris TaxID=73501 RepID=A0A2H4SFE2_CORMI|nr:hypothetical protein A9K55_008257 [Cordyceps militaris]
MASRANNPNCRSGPSRGRGDCHGEAATRDKTTPPPKQSRSKNPRRPHIHRPPKDRFGCGDTMESAQRMVDIQRRNAKHLSQTEYCGAPPLGQNLVQLRLVIPGDHLMPKALGGLGVLDDIRREHQVWITRERGSETFLDLCSKNSKSLHAALNAINGRIHHMRLSEESLTVQYFTQLPKENAGVAIKFEIGKRPVVESTTDNARDAEYGLSRLVAHFATILPSAVKSLAALPALKMQINFGYLKVLAKRKSVGNRLSCEEFESALGSYSSRGRGLSIDNEFPNVDVANIFVSSILNNDEIVQNKANVALKHLVQFDADKQTVTADLWEEDGVAKVASSRCTETESHPPLDWIVSAPAIGVDWTMRVSSHPNYTGDKNDKLLDATTKLAQSFTFKINAEMHNRQPKRSGEVAKEDMQRFQLPKWQALPRGDPTHVLSGFQLTSLFRLQYRDTPYEIETSITQHWARVPLSPEPDRLSWSVSVRGIHWEEALHECRIGESSSGEENLLRRLWPGEGSLEERLGGFLKCVFQVQNSIVTAQS